MVPVHSKCGRALKVSTMLTDTQLRVFLPGRNGRGKRRGRGRTMRKTNWGLWVLVSAAVFSYGCFRASHPSHKPDEQGNAAPLKDVASIAHAKDANQLEPYDAVDHLYRNAKSSLPTTVRLAVLDTADWNAIWKRVVGPSSIAPLPTVDFSREMLLVV